MLRFSLAKRKRPLAAGPALLLEDDEDDMNYEAGGVEPSEADRTAALALKEDGNTHAEAGRFPQACLPRRLAHAA